jgi:hypothetical protein
LKARMLSPWAYSVGSLFISYGGFQGMGPDSEETGPALGCCPLSSPSRRRSLPPTGQSFPIHLNIIAPTGWLLDLKQDVLAHMIL